MFFAISKNADAKQFGANLARKKQASKNAFNDRKP